MKRNLIGTLSLVVLFLLLNATGAYAQSAVKANVPFAFTVGTAQLPAGSYPIMSKYQNMLLIRNDETGGYHGDAGPPGKWRRPEPQAVVSPSGQPVLPGRDLRSSGQRSDSRARFPVGEETRIATSPSNTGKEVVIAHK